MTLQCIKLYKTTLKNGNIRYTTPSLHNQGFYIPCWDLITKYFVNKGYPEPPKDDINYSVIVKCGSEKNYEEWLSEWKIELQNTLEEINSTNNICTQIQKDMQVFCEENSMKVTLRKNDIRVSMLTHELDFLYNDNRHKPKTKNLKKIIQNACTSTGIEIQATPYYDSDDSDYYSYKIILSASSSIYKKNFLDLKNLSTKLTNNINDLFQTYENFMSGKALYSKKTLNSLGYDSLVAIIHDSDTENQKKILKNILNLPPQKFIEAIKSEQDALNTIAVNLNMAVQFQKKITEVKNHCSNKQIKCTLFSNEDTSNEAIKTFEKCKIVAEKFLVCCERTKKFALEYKEPLFEERWPDIKKNTEKRIEILQKMIDGEMVSQDDVNFLLLALKENIDIKHIKKYPNIQKAIMTSKNCRFCK